MVYTINEKAKPTVPYIKELGQILLTKEDILIENCEFQLGGLEWREGIAQAINKFVREKLDLNE